MRIAEHRDAAEVQLGSTLLGRELRTLAICLLAAALVVALILRFSNLAGESEMSSDEGADWAAASAPTLSEVQQLGVAFNAGKLALYDVVLHFWIEAFGESLTSMRALSAVLGVRCHISIPTWMKATRRRRWPRCALRLPPPTPW